MKVLWVTPHLPDPVQGGGWSTEYEFLRLAARHHDITLLTGGLPPGARSVPIDELGVRTQGVTWRLREPRNRAERLWRLVAPGGPVEFWQKREVVAALQQGIRAAEAAERYDLVQVMLGEIGPVITTPRAPTAYFLFDVYSRWMQRQSAQATAARHRFMWWLETRATQRWERRWYPHADGLAVVSPVDAEELRTFVDTPVAVIPIPVGDEHFVPPARTRQPGVVTLVSSLNYLPNVDSVDWFCRSIWPRIVAQRPTARLRVVGRGPSDDVRRAVAAAGAELHADVPDARPYYWEAEVSVVPLRLGAGMRNKVLHAMAARSPIVATSVAIEGIGVTPGRHLVVGDDEASFAAAVVDTLDDQTSAQQRVDAAYEFVERYRADVIGAELEAWWSAVARRSGPASDGQDGDAGRQPDTPQQETL
jgi:glycosyltransferase involved in cell wall biosynthesis